MNPLTGKRPLTFKPDESFTDLPVTIPCGKCQGCKSERARQWAVRMINESQLHDKNCVLTLTYNNTNLPKGGTLDKRHVQLFIKRLRKQFGQGIKYYACGEYGKKLRRPHYHLCMFGFDLPDKTLWIPNLEPDRCIYRSPILETLWPLGFSSVGILTPQSASYVSRYVTKKITGPSAATHYNGLLPEFALMSRGGKSGRGLAYDWIRQYGTDVYPKDFLTINGKKHHPPRYYDTVYAEHNPDILQTVKTARKQHARTHQDSLRRLSERETYHNAIMAQYPRSYETSEEEPPCT